MKSQDLRYRNAALFLEMDANSKLRGIAHRSVAEIAATFGVSPTTAWQVTAQVRAAILENEITLAEVRALATNYHGRYVAAKEKGGK